MPIADKANETWMDVLQIRAILNRWGYDIDANGVEIIETDGGKMLQIKLKQYGQN